MSSSSAHKVRIPHILIIAPRFFDAIYGEKRAMMSAYKTALALAEHACVTVVTAGPPPRREQVSDRLTVYRLWDLFLPDPINYGIVPGIFTSLLPIIWRTKPDAILVNKHMFFTSLAVPLLRLLGHRVVVQTDTFPGINWFPRNPLVGLVMRLYAWTIGLFVLKTANHVVLLHEGLVPVARWLRLPHSVIHNGVDLERFDAALPAADIEKRTGDVHVCYVGRLESVKGYDDLLAVAHQLVPEFRHVKFFFVGSTDGKEDIVAAHTSPQIIFTGHRKDIPSVLKRMDIFVLPSYSEGLPNALMEAMAVGCAPVASNVGGVKILLRDETGLSFQPGDRDALQGHLQSLITNPLKREGLRKKARGRIEHSFHLAKEVVRLHDALLIDPHQNQDVPKGNSHMNQLKAYLKKAQLLFANRDNLKRAGMLDVAMDFVRHNTVGGDYFEFGVYAGRTFQYAYHAARLRHLRQMKFYAFDSFEGFSQPNETDDIGHVQQGGRNCSEKQFIQNVTKAGVPKNAFSTFPGWFEQTLVGKDASETNERLGNAKISIAWLDADLYEPTRDALHFLTPRLQDGSVLIFDNWFLFKGHPDRGERRAFTEWKALHPELQVSEFYHMGWHGASFIVHPPIETPNQTV